jgi:hypothetical protein
MDEVYDSAENLNNVTNESGTPNAELLLDLLESMRGIDRRFEILFDQGVVFDENWPRQLTLTEKMKKYELGYALVVASGLNEEYYFPHPKTFRGITYHGVSYNQAPPPPVRRAMTIRPGSPIPGPSNRTVPEPGTTTVIPMPNPIEGVSDPNFVLHPGLEEENRELTRRGHAVLDHELVTNPRMRNLSDDPFENGHDEIWMNSAEMSAEISRDIPIDTDVRTLRDLLVRCLLRSEIMNIQLNNALGLKTKPPTNAGKRHTWVNMLSRYDYVANSMDTREAEIQELNHGPDRNNNQEMLQGPHWIQHGVPVPVPAQADPEPETPCTKDHCSCPGPVYCQWEQETEVPEPRNIEIATGTQDEATGFQDVSPLP